MNAIGETVQRLRRAKGLTQGQLANQLGVSSAAVSKWETGGALPDVALLCPLARALGCSADELLGFRPELSPEEIDAVCKTPRALFDGGDWRGALEFCRQRLREYPGDLNLRFRLGFLLAGFADKTRDEAAREELCTAAAGLFEQAVELPDEEQRRAAWRMLARLYADKGQFDRALEALGNLPSCNQEGLGLRADILRRMGDLNGAARLEETTLSAQLAALDHTLTSFAATRRAQGLNAEAERLEQQARRLKELFGAPAAPAGCCCECEGEASE